MIEIRDVQVKYDDFVAIDDMNLHIEQGDFFTLLGPSGCGKSTMLRAIAGFNPPSRGHVYLKGEDITYQPVEHRGLGMVFQSYALFPTMTVYDNISYGLEVQKKSKAEIERRVTELAEMVELTSGQLARNVSELSGGQQQRVAIARAMAQEPEIILFDEPLSNLDAKLRKQLRQELKDIQHRTGMTAVYVTHDQEEALEMSDRIAVFNDGRIEQIGTPQEIYHESATEFVCRFIGEANFLSPETVACANEQSERVVLAPDHHHYLRNEKLHVTPPSEGSVKLETVVEAAAFTGTLTTYTCRVPGGTVRMVTVEDGRHQYAVGDSLPLYFDPADVLSYEVK